LPGFNYFHSLTNNLAVLATF